MNRVWIISLLVAVILAESPAEQGGYESNKPGSSYGAPGHKPGDPIGLAREDLGQSEEQCPPNDLQANKALVKRAYQEIFGNHDLTNVDNYFTQDYIQHAPLVPDGIQGLKDSITKGPLGQNPKMQLDFRRVSAEDDLVWTHARIPFLGKIFAAVDIWRIECGKIKEHWDVLQDTDLMGKQPGNPQPFF